MVISSIIVIIVVLIAIIVYSIQSAKLLILKQRIEDLKSNGKYQIVPIRRKNDTTIFGYKVNCYVRVNKETRYSPSNWRKVYDSLLDHPPFKTKEEAIIVGLKYFIVRNCKVCEEYYDNQDVSNLIH